MIDQKTTTVKQSSTQQQATAKKQAQLSGTKPLQLPADQQDSSNIQATETEEPKLVAQLSDTNTLQSPTDQQDTTKLNDQEATIFKRKIKNIFKFDEAEEAVDVLKALGALAGKSTDPELKSLPEIDDNNRKRFATVVRELAILMKIDPNDLISKVKSLRPNLIKESFTTHYIKYMDVRFF